MNEEIIKEVIKMYTEGVSVKQIVTDCNVTYNALYNILNANNIPLRYGSRANVYSLNYVSPKSIIASVDSIQNYILSQGAFEYLDDIYNIKEYLKNKN